MKIKGVNLFYYACVILLVSALTQNAFFVDNEGGQTGYLVLVLGFYAAFDTGFSWLANLFIVFSYISRKKKSSLYFSLIAIILGVSFLSVEKIITGTDYSYGKITG